MRRAAPTLSAALVAALVAGPAAADGCARSRDYILTGLSGELPHKPQAYRELFRQCLETLQLSNVKDAFILAAGAVAVVPRVDTVAATAGTLAQFCTRFPRGTLHVVPLKKIDDTRSVARAVRMSFPGATSCVKIRGGG